MIAVVDADEFGDRLFRVFAYVSAALVVASFLAISDLRLSVTSAAVSSVAAIVNASRWYRRVPGALMLSFLTLTYFQFPVFYVGYARAYYDFSVTVRTPGPSSEYLRSFTPAVLFFTGCCVVFVIGAAAGRWRNERFGLTPARMPLNGTSLACLLVVGLIVCWVSARDLLAIFNARAAQAAKAESVIALLFNDRAYQLLFPVLFYLYPLRLEARSSKAAFLTVLSLFLFLNVYGTSKAAILLIGISFFLYPAAMFYRHGVSLYWPKTWVFVAGALLSFPLYLFSMIDREFRATGQELTFEAFGNAVLFIVYNSGGVAAFVLDSVATRFSINLNNFVLIFAEFVSRANPPNPSEFVTYVWRSLLNLILPGTPYPESYVLSSQLLPDVIGRQPLISRLDRISFLTSANTQPYTIFGFLLIIIGPILTLFAAFVSGVVYSVAFSAARNIVGRLLIVFSATAFYSSYGFEAAAQMCLLIAVTSYFMILIISVAGSLVRRRHTLAETVS